MQTIPLKSYSGELSPEPDSDTDIDLQSSLRKYNVRSFALLPSETPFKLEFKEITPKLGNRDSPKRESDRKAKATSHL
jgi:hypothetical protein